MPEYRVTYLSGRTLTLANRSVSVGWQATRRGRVPFPRTVSCKGGSTGEPKFYVSTFGPRQASPSRRVRWLQVLESGSARLPRLTRPRLTRHSPQYQARPGT